jgi:hypothetical protein
MKEIDNLRTLLRQNNIENIPNAHFISEALDKLIEMDNQNKIELYQDFTDKSGRVWEWFVDESYYQMVCVRRKGIKDFNNQQSFHFNSDTQAKQFVSLLSVSS